MCQVICPWDCKSWILFLLLCMKHNTFFSKGIAACYHLLQPPSKAKRWAGQAGGTLRGQLYTHTHPSNHGCSVLAGWKPLYKGLWPVAFTNSHIVKLQEAPQDKAPAKYTYSRNIFFHLTASETIRSANNSVPESGKKNKPNHFPSKVWNIIPRLWTSPIFIPQLHFCWF